MHAVKFQDGSDVVIEGPGLPYGGLHNGFDLDRQKFTAKTDFALDWFGEGARPVLYHHGMDEDAGLSVVGRVKSWEVKTDLGIWTRAQLDKQSKYFAAIKELVDKGALYFSSGAMAHLVKVNDKTGEITRWPWVELSLTPTPANLLATVDIATADKHYKAAGLTLPDSLKVTLDAAGRDALDDSDFAYIDADGKRHLPMNDPEHARAALARFGQTTFADTASRDKAWKKLVARCKELEVEVTAEMPMKSVDLKALTGSYEDLIRSLQHLVNPWNPFGTPATYTSIEDTYPDHVIVCRNQEDERSYWRIPYTLDPSGQPSLGVAAEVEETYIPVRQKAYLPETSLSTQADTVAHYAATLTERTKDLGQRRVKEGRVLSMATRRRLSESSASMRAALDELDTFLDSTDPAKAEAKANLDALMYDVDLLELTSAL